MDTIGDPAKPLNQLQELVTKENCGKRELLEQEAKLNAKESGSKDEKFPPTMSGLEVNETILASGIYAVTKPDHDKVIFKKPVVIIGSMRKKVTAKLQGNINDKASSSTVANSVENPVSYKPGTTCQSVNPSKNTDPPLLAPIPYSEPSWAGYPNRVYSFEIFKGGQVIENFGLSRRSCHSIGRSPINDVVLLHPTMSRFHAVIQFRDEDKGTPEKPSGMYIYDMASTHGTFLNKCRIKPRMYIRVHVGHILKFGASTRHFLLKGPPEDQEDESWLSLTEIKNQRNNELMRRKLEEIKGKVGDEEQGISWGMDDDADEETDLSINPFATTNNEELYIEDPKKTLRGWFEREGHELVYNVEEESPGHFRCSVDVPVESCRGGRHVAEATVQGKKKEAVLQCALEACRVLDRYGLLRQATHESKKRKAKDWEAEDFYDSDDDTYLDRTGAIESKREARIAASNFKTESLSYPALVAKHQEVLRNLASAAETLSKLNVKAESKPMKQQESPDCDALDEYMASLQKSTERCDKASVSRLKMRIKNLTAESKIYLRLLGKASPSFNCHGASADPKGNERLVFQPPPPSPACPKTAKNPQYDDPQYDLDWAAVEKIWAAEGPDPEDLPVEEEMKSEGSGGGTQPSSSGYETGSGTAQASVLDDVRMKTGIGELSTITKPIQETIREMKRAAAAGNEKTPDSAKKQKVGKDGTGAEEQDEGMGTDEECNGGGEKVEVKKKKRNRTRNKLKSLKSQSEQSGLCSTPAESPELFSNWTPPEGQSGDGRTSLNEKLGY